VYEVGGMRCNTMRYDLVNVTAWMPCFYFLTDESEAPV